MKTLLGFTAAALAVLALALPALADAPVLKEGVPLEVGGKPLDIKVGHLVPVAVDWDLDGRQDLLVGQFLGGKICLYRNVGSKGKPVFTEPEVLKAGGKDISLPAG